MPFGFLASVAVCSLLVGWDLEPWPAAICVQ
jgi:hypothetical protein